MDEISLQRARKAYERFKLQWMIDHGFTLGNLIACMEDMVCEDLSDSEVRTSLQSLFANWEYGVGFAGGSVWPCFEEYLQSDAHSEDDWEPFAGLQSYAGDDFCFAEKTAWSNLDDDCNCDWLIVEIS